MRKGHAIGRSCEFNIKSELLAALLVVCSCVNVMGLTFGMVVS